VSTYSQIGTARNAQGEIDPYASRWTPGSWSGLGASTGENQTTPFGWTYADQGSLPMGTEQYWSGVGFGGNPYVQNGSGDNVSRDLSPELLAWARQQGITPGFTEGYGGLLQGGKPVQNSAFGNLTNDDATFIAGMLGLGGVGYAANAAGLGVNAAGEATGGAFGAAGQTAPTITPEQAAKAASAAGTANQVLKDDATGDPGSAPVGDNGTQPGGPGTSQTTTPSAGQPVTNANGADPWQSLKDYGGSIADWMKENPTQSKALVAMLGAAGATAGGSSSGGGGYVDSGYRPTITRGNWSASVKPNTQPRTPATQMGLLNVPTTGQQNDGLWRYGLLGK
jgi:hypothetical protein